jgi:hypothetical protein
MSEEKKPRWVIDPQPNITIKEMAEIIRGARIYLHGEETVKRFHKSVHRHFKRLGGEEETKNETGTK